MSFQFNKKYLSQFFTLLLLFSIAIVSCQKDDEKIIIDAVFPESETLLDQSYGKNKDQKIDIYLPANRSRIKTKVLLLIHGGAWFSGDKEEMNIAIPYLQDLFGNEYAIVNMNYRLVNFLGFSYMLPNQTDDIGAVMDYIEQKSAELGVKSEFVNIGVSAGGHLSMLYAYKFDNKKRVKTVVNIVGPTDLSDSFYTNDPLYNLGLTYITQSKNVPEGMTATQYASPVTWVSSTSCPTISFYGDNDHLIPNNQWERLEGKLIEYNVPHESHIYDGGHDIAEKYTEDIILKAKAFIDRYK